eukprot:g7689.t1
MSVRQSARSFAYSLVQYGQAWWFPLLICAVSITNSVTAGALIWCVGVVQGLLYSTFILSNPGPKGIFLGPACLCTGSCVAAKLYIELMKAGGAEFVLEKTNLMGSSYIETAGDYGQKYGMWGLFFLQVSPIPVPTAILVITGMLSGVDEWQIFCVVGGAKYVQLALMTGPAGKWPTAGPTIALGATAMQFSLLKDGKPVDEVLAEHVFGMGGEGGSASSGKEEGQGGSASSGVEGQGARRRGRGLQKK